MLQRSYQSSDVEQIKPGEWHDVLWHQYMNCVDALRAQNASTVASEGVSSFMSYPSWEGFEGNVAILESMCEGYGLLDDGYKQKAPPEESKERDSRKVFSALTDLLKRKGVWKEDRPYLGRI